MNKRTPQEQLDRLSYLAWGILIGLGFSGFLIFAVVLAIDIWRPA